jgi:hypothetical protein
MYVENGVIPCVTAVHRAMDMTKAALEAIGHKVIQFDIPEIPSMCAKFMNLLCPVHDYFDEYIRGEKRTGFNAKPSIIPASILFKIAEWKGYERILRIVRNIKPLSS